MVTFKFSSTVADVSTTLLSVINRTTGKCCLIAFIWMVKQRTRRAFYFCELTINVLLHKSIEAWLFTFSALTHLTSQFFYCNSYFAVVLFLFYCCQICTNHYNNEMASHYLPLFCWSLVLLLQVSDLGIVLFKNFPILFRISTYCSCFKIVF